MLEFDILLDAMPLLASPQLWAWIAIAAAVGYLLWLLSPILAPFLFAGILACIFDPLVELALGTVVALLLVVAPLFYKETRLLLAEWLRGQMPVIVLMSVYYVVARSLTGLKVALPIGIITGLAVIVPYVGIVVGLAA